MTQSQQKQEFPQKPKKKKKNWNCKGRTDNAHQSKQNQEPCKIQGSNSKNKASVIETKKKREEEAKGTKIKKINNCIETKLR